MAKKNKPRNNKHIIIRIIYIYCKKQKCQLSNTKEPTTAHKKPLNLAKLDMKWPILSRDSVSR